MSDVGAVEVKLIIRNTKELAMRIHRDIRRLSVPRARSKHILIELGLAVIRLSAPPRSIVPRFWEAVYQIQTDVGHQGEFKKLVPPNIFNLKKLAQDAVHLNGISEIHR